MGSGGTDSVLKPFEDRAAKAEERLARLEAALDNIDAGGASQGAGGLASEERLKFLGALKQLRGTLAQAQMEQEALAKQRDEAVQEKAKLAADNLKLQYRVKHLVRAVREGDERLEEAKVKLGL